MPIQPAAPPPTPDWGQFRTAFVENVGQVPQDARYVSLALGYEIQITPHGARLIRPAQQEQALDLRFPGSKPAEPVAEAKTAGVFHHYPGRQAPQLSVPTYQQVRQPNLYPGIDAVYYGTQSALEYDFVVHPGADPAAIRVAFPNGPVTLHADGSVRVHDQWLHRAPVAYQVSAGVRREVKARALLDAAGAVRFEVGAYDRSLDLVIDPIMELRKDFTTINLSGVGTSRTSVAVASDGSIAVTAAGDLLGIEGGNPGEGGIRIAKFDPQGATVFVVSIVPGDRYSTSVNALAIDGQGRVVAGGSSTARDLPTTANAFQRNRRLNDCPPLGLCATDAILTGRNSDGWVGRFTTAGTVDWLTYIGSHDFDSVNALVLAPGGAVYMTGVASGTLFPTPGGFQNCLDGKDLQGSAFFVEMNSIGTDVTYGTCLRPSLVSPLNDRFSIANGIAIDRDGNAYIAGWTNTGAIDSFPTRGANGRAPFRNTSQGKLEAFTAKFNPNLQGDASLIYSTLLGGVEDDRAFSITVDSANQACIAGDTRSAGFPVRSPIGSNTPLNSHRGSQDLFVSCLSADASALNFSNLYGGSSNEARPALVQTPAGDLFVAGPTTSLDMPVVNPFNDGTGANAMVVKLNAGTRTVAIQSRAPVEIDTMTVQGSTVFTAGGVRVHSILDCTRELNDLRVNIGVATFDPNTGTFKRIINVSHANASTFPIPAGRKMTLSGLDPTTELINRQGISSCLEPGRPFIELPQIPHFRLGGVNIQLEFRTVAFSATEFVPRVSIPVALP